MSGPDVIPLLIKCGFQATLPLGGAWVTTRFASRFSAATRHFIWACATAIAVLLPLATIVVPRWSVAAPASFARLASTTHIVAAPSTIRSVPTTEPLRAYAAVRPKGGQPGGLTLRALAISIWITGAVVVFLYALTGHFGAWRLYRATRGRRDSWTRDVERLTREVAVSSALRVVESSAVTMPVVLHVLRPIIVMPSAARQWSQSRIRAVLLHEFAHIRRNDLRTQALTQLACVLYWFNPLTWIGAHELRLERERACDDFVLLRGTSGPDYATHLFEIARGSLASPAPFAIGIAACRSQLEQRLAAIVNPHIPRHSASMLCRFLVVLPMVMVALAAGAVQVTRKGGQVPEGPIGIASAIQLRAAVPALSTGGTGAKMHPARTELTAQPQEFRWAAKIHAGQEVEVHLGRGAIRVLPSSDDIVHVRARTDDARHSEIRAVSTSDGVKFCNIVTTVQISRDYCDPGEDTSGIQDNPPAIELTINVPAGLRFAASTNSGDISAQYPDADSNMATISGNITLELSGKEGANFTGNVIAGTVESDFPLTDNAPPLLTSERPAASAPRIVHAIFGSGGPRLSAMVVNGNIRLIRRPAH